MIIIIIPNSHGLCFFFFFFLLLLPFIVSCPSGSLIAPMATDTLVLVSLFSCDAEREGGGGGKRADAIGLEVSPCRDSWLSLRLSFFLLSLYINAFFLLVQKKTRRDEKRRDPRIL